MHIMEGFLPVEWAAAWYVVAAPFVGYGAYKTAKSMDSSRSKALLAVSAGFIFVLSALKMPSVTGSTSHPTGTGLAVVLFGPVVTSFLSAVVLLYQSLLLAHGGITTLGANVASMGVIGPFVGYGAYKLVRPRTDIRKSTFVAAVVTDWTTYVFTSLQLAVAFPSEAGIDGIMSSAARFMGIFAVTQIPIGIVEGALAAAVVGYLVKAKDSVRKRMGVPA
ncbi:energy-coupling factor ABC transporter permease [Halorutilales archaeon Cl-col2-1]